MGLVSRLMAMDSQLPTGAALLPEKFMPGECVGLSFPLHQGAELKPMAQYLGGVLLSAMNQQDAAHGLGSVCRQQ